MKGAKAVIMHLLKSEVKKLTHNSSWAFDAVKVNFLNTFTLQFFINPSLHKIRRPSNFLVFFDYRYLVEFDSTLNNIDSFNFFFGKSFQWNSVIFNHFSIHVRVFSIVEIANFERKIISLFVPVELKFKVTFYTYHCYWEKTFSVQIITSNLIFLSPVYNNLCEIVCFILTDYYRNFLVNIDKSESRHFCFLMCVMDRWQTE